MKKNNSCNAIERLGKWFQSQCNGDWEHSSGIKIETLDNPGWWFAVELEGTKLYARPFDSLELERTEMDWIHCRIKDGKFNAVGGPENLREMINIFLEWAEGQK
ncbi:MAG: immunity 53 family protein [Thermoleophilia bacterium]